MEITVKPIGIIHTPHKKIEGMPIQPSGAAELEGTVHFHNEYITALKSLDGFSHVILIYYFHKQKGWKPIVTPFMDTVEHGVFATRAPSRPNPIGLSIVSLKSVAGNKITFTGADMLDGTPLLDIKPYVPKFDTKSDVTTGWLQKNAEKVQKTKSDNRFQ